MIHSKENSGQVTFEGNDDDEEKRQKHPGECYNPNTTEAMNYFAFETDVR